MRVGAAFRLLLFVCTCLAVAAGHALIAFLIAGHDDGSLAALTGAVGLALAVATEVQIGSLRRRQGATEAATSWMAFVYLMGALAWFVHRHLSHAAGWRGEVGILCLAAAALLGAAAWRWDYPFYAGAAAASLLLGATQLPAGRLWWIALPLATAPLLLRAADSSRLAPAHRASAAAVLVIALAALYTAVHLGSWQARLVEDLGGSSAATPRLRGDLSWWAAAAATAAVPLALLAGGLRRRRYPLLLLGAGTAVASLVTLCTYVHLAPPWLALSLGGCLLVALVLALERHLRSGVGGERHGYTAALLFADLARASSLEAGAAMLTLTPAAHPPGAKPAYEGGGGRSGGGGATGEY